MGFWNLVKNLNNADGVREAMRISYTKHMKGAASGAISRAGSTPHQVGLFGALATRYRLRGVRFDEVGLWSELAPFIAMGEADGIEAIAEYVLTQERPDEARGNWFVKKLNDVIREMKDEKMVLMAAVALGQGVHWSIFVDRDLREKLHDLFVRSSMEQWADANKQKG